MGRPEPTILTKWGRLTRAQWLEARHREAIDAWWTPEVEAYVAEEWPTPEQLAINQRRRSAPTGTAPLPPRPSAAWRAPIVPVPAQAPDSGQHLLSF